MTVSRPFLQTFYQVSQGITAELELLDAVCATADARRRRLAAQVS